MKSGCLDADRKYTKPISHSGDLSYETEQSFRSCQQAQIPSVKGLAPCIISRARVGRHSLLGKLRCAWKQGKHSGFRGGEHLFSFKVFQPLYFLLLPSFSVGWVFLARGKLPIFLQGWKTARLEQKDIYCPRPSKFLTLIWLLHNSHEYELGNVMMISYKQYLYIFVRSIYNLKQRKYFKAMELDIFFFFISSAPGFWWTVFCRKYQGWICKTEYIRCGHQIHLPKTVYYVCYSLTWKSLGIHFTRSSSHRFLCNSTLYNLIWDCHTPIARQLRRSHTCFKSFVLLSLPPTFGAWDMSIFYNYWHSTHASRPFQTLSSLWTIPWRYISLLWGLVAPTLSSIYFGNHVCCKHTTPTALHCLLIAVMCLSCPASRVYISRKQRWYFRAPFYYLSDPASYPTFLHPRYLPWTLELFIHLSTQHPLLGV